MSIVHHGGRKVCGKQSMVFVVRTPVQVAGAPGDTIQTLRLHNKDRPGAAPVLMTQASWP